MLTGAQILWESLVRQGVTDVFGYPGGAILPAYDAMLGYPIRHVLVRHEQGATHMADGYARASGRVGVAIATSGPGATNMVTGIATAMMDSSPIVCITGQVGSTLIGSDAFQETDITGITLPITKHNYLVTRAEDIAPSVFEAFAVAGSGRPGPVLVDIAKDAQQACCEVDWDAADVPLGEASDDVLPGDADRRDAIALINAAKRPLILAGHGVMLSGAEDQVLELAERAQIPVAVTLLGIGGVPASHPLMLGMMGMHGDARVNHAIQEADLLIALGMRFDDRVTGNPRTYAPAARKIHVDVDRAELNKTVRVDVAIARDVRATVDEWLPHVARRDRSAWLARIEGKNGSRADGALEDPSGPGHLRAAHVISDLWRLTGGDAVVVTDVGQHQMWEAQHYKHDRPRSLITSGGLGTMGFALPAAIGAKIASPEAEVWVIAGDGGFQMTMAELGTVAQENLDLNIAVINNGCLGMVRQWQELFYERRYAATPLVDPDFAQIAAAFGIAATTVTRRDQVAGAIEAARRLPRAALIEFKVDQEDLVYPMVPAGADLHDMIRASGLRSGKTIDAANFRRIRRQQAGRAEPRGVAVPPPCVQYRVADRRSHRDDRRLADDRRGRDRRVRRAPARGAPEQARAGPPRRQHHGASVDLTGPGAHQGGGRRGGADPRDAAGGRVPRPRHRRRPRIARRRDDRHHGEDRQPGRRAAAVRRARNGQDRAGRDGAPLGAGPPDRGGTERSTGSARRGCHLVLRVKQRAGGSCGRSPLKGGTGNLRCA